MSSVQSSSAVGALRALRLLTAESDRTMIRMATGLRIAEASDNAAFWSVATTMRAQKAVFSAVEDSIGVALGIVGAALAVQQPVIDNMQEMMNDLIRGNERTPNNIPWSDAQLKMLDTDMFNRSKMIGNMISSAYFNGVNLLYRPNGKQTSFDFVVGAENSGGALKLQTMTMDMTKIALIDGDPSTATNFGIMSKPQYEPSGFTSVRYFFTGNSAWGPSGYTLGFYPTGLSTSTFQKGHIKAHMYILNRMQQQVNDVFAYLGAVKSRLEQQLEQAKRMQSLYQKGVGGLVDADMNEDSARQKALATQTQLATEMLNIVNGRASHVLELFRV